MFVSLLTCLVSSAESINFLSRQLTAGKASLTENGFVVSRTIGSANFSPELKLPVQLIYNSSSEKTRIFGFAWKSPQLESSACYDRGGVLWTTPWGENIKFFPKDTPKKKDAMEVEIFEAAKKGRGFYAPYSDWEADTDFPKAKIQQSGDWVFSGKGKYKDWQFVYKNTKLVSITSPSKRTIFFQV